MTQLLRLSFPFFNSSIVSNRGFVSLFAARGAACTTCRRVRKIGIVEFEFDLWKSESNKAKHGIDFVEVQALWKAKHVILAAKDTAEKRYLVIGTIDHEHWSAIITYRGARIRIISVRKSAAAEIHRYEKLAE